MSNKVKIQTDMCSTLHHTPLDNPCAMNYRNKFQEHKCTNYTEHTVSFSYSPFDSRSDVVVVFIENRTRRWRGSINFDFTLPLSSVIYPRWQLSCAVFARTFVFSHLLFCSFVLCCLALLLYAGDPWLDYVTKNNRLLIRNSPRTLVDAQLALLQCSFWAKTKGWLW